MMISIKDFCDRHGACQDAREWALTHCEDAADAWATLRPGWLVWVATRPGVLTDRELRLFAVFCARQVEHLLSDQRSRDAIDAAEKFAKGEATREELIASYDASYDASWAATWAASWAAAAAADADASWAAQADWLRTNTQPNFGIGVQ